jgi:hypothetical protein
MDQDQGARTQAALRARAEAAIAEALSAADGRAPFLGGVVSDTMEAVSLVCWDAGLDAHDRLALIHDALPVLAALKELARAAQDARPALLEKVLRGTNGLLRGYARLVRTGARRPR